MAHVVTSAAIRVAVPTRQKGIWDARILKKGDFVPGNARKKDLAWLVERGFVAEVQAKTETDEKETSPTGEVLFDPNEHKVADVIAYLESADEDERARVLEAEAEGQDRKGIRDWEPETAEPEVSEAEGDQSEAE